MNNLEKKILVMHLLDGLLIKIEKEKHDKISPNEEMFFEAQHVLYKHDYNEGIKYSLKYNEIMKEF